MEFQRLQENLRRILCERIAAKRLSGLRLARETGFQQAHISNFLNRKRGLSLEGMDKVLAAQKMSVLDLLDAAEIKSRQHFRPQPRRPSKTFYWSIPTAANEPLITRERVRDVYKFIGFCAV